MKSSSIYQDYLFIYPRIGKGSFGDVYKVVHKKNGLIRAVKQIIGDRNDTIRDLSEFDILKRLVCEARCRTIRTSYAYTRPTSTNETYS